MKKDVFELELGKKLQNYRNMRKMTMKELGDKTGITPSMLSQIERDLVNPSINTLKVIAKALDVPLFMFFKEDEDETQNLVVRSNSRKTIGNVNNGDIRYDLLTPTTKGEIEFCMMYIPPKNFSSEHIESHKGEEVAYLIKGKVEIIVGTTSYLLEKGDSIRIPSLTEHRWINNSDEEVEVIFAITPPSF